ncbi:histidinol-phosphatase [Bauldia litoralis]|uniref:Histidinol-phosphatase n=1 Tax=Bauldia litoralis TaxID=665467 RepID=A0A1G6A486_9HYPH|nr:histidinol-phosphatase [Bauldia litoralis]SDB03222.1 myo-inositol-1(or 4)-monophosphatase [Bauldia litoralis]
MDVESLSAFVDRLADTASDSIMPLFRASVSVENKSSGGFDPVTAADREAEAAMRKLIGEAYPDHGIVGEEYGSDRADAEFVWVLDPIDGTRAFITGLPVWGCLIGLLHQGKPVLGMMAQPFTGERYAGDGKRAWYTGPGGARTIATRPCNSLAEAALFTTSPSLFPEADLPDYQRVERAVRLARYGVDCYAYCMVGSGHADIVVEAGLQSYDIVALIPMIEGAGGRVTTWDGGSAASGGRIAATGDPRLHEKVLETLAAA